MITLTKSKNFSGEYCATVVQLGEIKEIEGANTVAKTEVNGRTIVVSKMCNKGDLMIYISNECQICPEFLTKNNLYRDYMLNSNFDEVEKYKLSTEDTIEQQKEFMRTHTGYFENTGRVRMQKFAGELSMGVLFTPQEFYNWVGNDDILLSENVGVDFDEVNGIEFVKPYIPQTKARHKSFADKRNSRLKRFNRIIPGQFVFHYDTQQLEKNITRIKPDDIITITPKIHGTSFILSNCLVNKPIFGKLYERVFNYLPKCLQFTKQEHDVIYSSRRVIKNAEVNPNAGSYSVGLDRTFEAYYEMLKDYIQPNYTIYGEIFGYEEGTHNYIQTVGKGYDYRCKPKENKLMIYRVAYTNSNGTKYEFNVDEVAEFTDNLKIMITDEGRKDIAERLFTIPILYHGPAAALFIIDEQTHWHENFLENLKHCKEFYMECNEPLCKNAVPREGIVLRVDGDPVAEAFKLKCLKFLQKESQEIDKGNIDTESEERY